MYRVVHMNEFMCLVFDTIHFVCHVSDTCRYYTTCPSIGARATQLIHVSWMICDNELCRVNQDTYRTQNASCRTHDWVVTRVPQSPMALPKRIQAESVFVYVSVQVCCPHSGGNNKGPTSSAACMWHMTPFMRHACSCGTWLTNIQRRMYVRHDSSCLTYMRRWMFVSHVSHEQSCLTKGAMCHIQAALDVGVIYHARCFSLRWRRVIQTEETMMDASLDCNALWALF